MEKPAKSKNKFLKLLPKAVAAAVTFQNPPFSPGRDKRSDNANKPKTHLGKGFSGSIISIIPAEARGKPKNSSFEAQEPRSPKVSCMGQIKHRNKIINKKKHVSLPKEFKPFSSPPEPEVLVKSKKAPTIKPVSSPAEVKKKPSTIRNIFSSRKPVGRKSDDSADGPPVSEKAPSLSQMRRFSIGRDTFANFDWMAPQISPLDSDQRDSYCSSDEEGGESSDGEREEFIIPFSAPILGGTGGGSGVPLEPRKEINLWKRRTMAQPRPLQLNTLVRSS